MGTALSLFSLLVASAACGLSLAVALRVKKLLDPLTEEGLLSRRGPAAGGPEVGDLVPRASGLIDIDGHEVELPPSGAQPWVLAFQAVGCPGCKEQLPTYKKFLRDMGFDRNRVVSVVVGDADGLPFYRDELGGLGHVVPAGEKTTDLVGGLGVTVFPTYLLVGEGGTVLVSTRSSARLAATGAEVLRPAPVLG
ncbi:TlpA family protein disulfide reductase [Streptomyces sp. NPDC101112]|uniref:TlpA family protein disulfide reductase n=1 Tax=Streptomyces sp. NPDC101112 TaxID=3366105 RepID=UPI003811D0A8